MTTTATTITKAQAEALRRTLRAGGEVRVHMGRTGSNDVHGHAWTRLLRAGLVEEVRVGGRLGRYATAAGCLVLNAFDAAIAAKGN